MHNIKNTRALRDAFVGSIADAKLCFKCSPLTWRRKPNLRSANAKMACDEASMNSADVLIDRATCVLRHVNTR